MQRELQLTQVPDAVQKSIKPFTYESLKYNKQRDIQNNQRSMQLKNTMMIARTRPNFSAVTGNHP